MINMDSKQHLLMGGKALQFFHLQLHPSSLAFPVNRLGLLTQDNAVYPSELVGIGMGS